MTIGEQTQDRTNWTTPQVTFKNYYQTYSKYLIIFITLIHNPIFLTLPYTCDRWAQCPILTFKILLFEFPIFSYLSKVYPFMHEAYCFSSINQEFSTFLHQSNFIILFESDFFFWVYFLKSSSLSLDINTNGQMGIGIGYNFFEIKGVHVKEQCWRDELELEEYPHPQHMPWWTLGHPKWSRRFFKSPLFYDDDKNGRGEGIYDQRQSSNPLWCQWFLPIKGS